MYGLSVVFLQKENGETTKTIITIDKICFILFSVWILLTINNIFKTSGEEQLRHDDVNDVKFPNKYLYSFGLTFMLSAAFTFN